MWPALDLNWVEPYPEPQAHMRKEKRDQTVETQISISTYFSELQEMLREISQAHLQDILALLEETYHQGHRIFIMGNGGSAATASHFALDLAKNTIIPGAPRVKAISLTDHVPLITAWSNDTAYEHIFAEQLANMIEPGDVVIGISASGNSLNVINALNVAKKSHARPSVCSEQKVVRSSRWSMPTCLLPGQNIEQEEDAHLILAHIITRHMREVVRSYAQQLAVAGTH